MHFSRCGGLRVTSLAVVVNTCCCINTGTDTVATAAIMIDSTAGTTAFDSSAAGDGDHDEQLREQE